MDDRFLPLSQTEPAASARPAVTPPEVPGFEIGPLLGCGGMGVVWQATQVYPHREVALKVMNAPALMAETARARFRMEVEVATRLEHPNIARVYQCSLERPPHYFTMELVKGRHLDEYVKQEGLAARQMAELMRSVCLAIVYAHQRGVIHRDIKPSNIIVTPDGQPHIVDFGVAKRLDDESSHLTVSGATGGPGTLAYMSPEQVTGKSVDTRTDIYSLGVVFYRLLTGRWPYDVSGPDYQTMQNIEQREALSLRRLNPDVDADLETIVLTMLAKDPAERYQSASELAQDIGNWLHGWALNVKSNRTWYVVRKLLRRHLGAGLVLLLVFVIAVSSTVACFYWYKRADSARREAEAKVVRLENEMNDLRSFGQQVRFAEFMRAWQQGRDQEAHTNTLGLASHSCQRLAADFLLGEENSTEDEFRRSLPAGYGWFADCIVAEQRLKAGDRAGAGALYGTCADKLAGGAPAEADPRLIAWVKGRLHLVANIEREKEPNGQPQTQRTE